MAGTKITNVPYKSISLALNDLTKDIVARWNNEINRIVQLPDEKEYLAALGIDAADASPEQFRAFLTREIEKWQKVVKAAGIKRL